MEATQALDQVKRDITAAAKEASGVEAAGDTGDTGDTAGLDETALAASGEAGAVPAPLITAAAVGGVLYYIAENKAFREMEFVKKHWWVRGFLAALVAVGLWRKGYATWATAVASAAMAMLLADYKNRDTKEAGDPEDAGEAGYWIGDHWYPHHRWDEPRRLEMARERWDERLAGHRRAEQIADRVFTGE